MCPCMLKAAKLHGSMGAHVGKYVCVLGPARTPALWVDRIMQGLVLKTQSICCDVITACLRASNYYDFITPEQGDRDLLRIYHP